MSIVGQLLPNFRIVEISFSMHDSLKHGTRTRLFWIKSNEKLFYQITKFVVSEPCTTQRKAERSSEFVTKRNMQRNFPRQTVGKLRGELVKKEIIKALLLDK